MKTITIAFITFFLFYLPISLFANSDNRRFYNVNDIYGVSLRGANSVCKDREGFIWISSKTGILRLGGDDLRKYLLPYVTADILTVDLAYANSELIAYTNNGQFFRYDNLYDQFELIFDARCILSNTHVVVHNVLIDKKGSFYIATSSGLYRYGDEEELELIGDSSKDELYIEWYKREENKIFIGRDGGIWEMDIPNQKCIPVFINNSTVPFHVSKLFYDRGEKKLWVGTNSGKLFFYDTEDNSFSKSELKNLPKQPILAIEANTDSTIMLGYDGQGLWELSRSGKKILNIYREDVDDPSSLSGNGVYDIYRDQNDRVWVCTYSGGVSFFDQLTPTVKQLKHRINDANSLGNNVVNDIFEDKLGNIWFATNNGISRWEMQENRWTNFYDSEKGQAKVFLSVLGDNRGNIWGGTWASGIFVLDGKTGKEKFHKGKDGQDNAHTGDFIFDITEDSQGDIWSVGVMESVMRFKKNTGDYSKYGAQPAYVIEELNSDEMLLGCSYGLVLLNKNTGSTKTLLDGYIIYDILIIDHEIWCCTSGEGLIRYNIESKKIRKYDINSGLPTNFVNSISLAKGYLWLGTESGLCRFDPKSEEVLTYSSIISLSNVSFNSDANCKLKDGKLMLGTNQGVIMFDPDLLEPGEAEGKIFLQDIIVSGKTVRDSSIYNLKSPLDSLTEISVKYDQNTITFELLSIGLSATESKFSWRLEDVDNNWSTPSSNRMVTFANLPSGIFELKIRLYNNSLSQIIDERSMKVEIKPPFWGRWWFYLIIALFVFGVIYFSFRYHINLIQQLHSEEKIRFFSNTAHEIRTSLTLIGGPIEEIRKESNLSGKGKYYLGLATEQMGDLLKFATQLLDFQKFDKGKEQLNLKKIDVAELVQQRKMMFETYSQKKDIQLIFNPAKVKCITAVDVGMMEKVVDNLLSNAIKYSPSGGRVFLNLFSNKKSWIFEVVDQGIGVSQKEQKQLFKEFYRSKNAVNTEIVGSGIGLLMVKNYVQMHGGSIKCVSQENKGSTFRIEIPLNSREDIPEKDIAKVKKSVPSSPFVYGKGVRKDVESKNRLNILIVEDNDNLRNFLEVSLSDNFNVHSATNGLEAWKTVRGKQPDLVVSDVMMPEMDGFELCRLVKSTYETSHIPMVLLTSLAGKAEQLQGLGLGADAYLTKPFDMGLLNGRIKSIITNRKAVREKALKLINHQDNGPLMENELNDKFVKRALEVVKENISNSKFGKDEFAFEMNASPSLLYKKIKALTDQAPSDFIRSIRLNYAFGLLQLRKYSVTEVSERAGFSSAGYFSTTFKKRYGKSPTDILECKE
jgi:signal transduction histidine kinase/CheY-like chemotaxis protein/ligand-binding sensor domain-containing protein/AraC-like DNA-binding protein